MTVKQVEDALGKPLSVYTKRDGISSIRKYRGDVDTFSLTTYIFVTFDAEEKVKEFSEEKSKITCGVKWVPTYLGSLLHRAVKGWHALRYSEGRGGVTDFCASFRF
jgi:hypothetical protein